MKKINICLDYKKIKKYDYLNISSPNMSFAVWVENLADNVNRLSTYEQLAAGPI